MPTWNDPSPLANPLNSRGRFAFGSPRPADARRRPPKLEVPNQDVPMFGSDEWNRRYAAQKELTVPN